MPDIMQMGKGSNYLGSWDLYDSPNQKIQVTIAKVQDEEVINQGKKETDALADDRCNGSAGRAHSREAAPAEDEERVKDNIGDSADHLRPHGELRHAR